MPLGSPRSRVTGIQRTRALAGQHTKTHDTLIIMQTASTLRLTDIQKLVYLPSDHVKLKWLLDPFMSGLISLLVSINLKI